MNISDFNIPTEYPWGMLHGYENASQKEDVLIIILCKCIANEDLHTTVTTMFEHPTMVTDGLLIKIDAHQYQLTTKSIGLLYSVYGKEV